TAVAPVQNRCGSCGLHRDPRGDSDAGASRSRLAHHLFGTRHSRDRVSLGTEVSRLVAHESRCGRRPLEAVAGGPQAGKTADQRVTQTCNQPRTVWSAPSTRTKRPVRRLSPPCCPVSSDYLMKGTLQMQLGS